MIIQKSLLSLEKPLKYIKTANKLNKYRFIERSSENIFSPETNTMHENNSSKNNKTINSEQLPKEQLINLFRKADLRVGEIIECKPVEDSTKLYIEKITFGNEVRQILSGLRSHVPIEEMKGKVVVFYNLKPRKIAGISSEGMLMCAENIEKTKVEILRPQADAKLGEKIVLADLNYELQGELGLINSKNLKKFLELLSVDADGQATFGKFNLSTENSLLLKSNISNGVIR